MFLLYEPIREAARDAGLSKKKESQRLSN
jgi:hypothetical protein